MDIFLSIFFNIKVCCVFSLESPHRGDSNEYIKHNIFNINTKISRNYPKYNNVCCFWIFFLGTQERVQNSHIKVLLYMAYPLQSRVSIKTTNLYILLTERDI